MLPRIAFAFPVLIGFILSGHAAAVEDRFSALPRIVRPAFESFAKRCHGAGGALAWSPEAVSVVDVSMDEIADYVVDTRHVRCEGPEQPWIADHGREVLVYVSVGPGSWVEAWKGYALSWRVDWEESRALLRVATRGVCRGAGPYCELTFAWRGTRLIEILRRDLDPPR